MSPHRMSFLFALTILGNVACTGSADPQEPKSCDEDEPPLVRLVTEAGTQDGVQGTFCFAGCCSDRSVDARQFTIVRPGDELWFSMPEGVLVVPGKEDEREPMFRISDLLSFQSFDSVPLAEDARWSVDLPVGFYEISTDSYFKGDDGTQGENHAYFGLAVDMERDRGVVDAVIWGVDAGTVSDAGN